MGNKMEVKLQNAEHLLKAKEIAGWMATASTAKDVNPLRVYDVCVKSGHWTPTRQMNFLFEISGVSRVFSHQFVRHSEGVNIVQESQRYVTNSLVDAVGAVIPASIAGKEIYIPELDVFLTPEELVGLTRTMYEGLLLEGDVKPEDARYVLMNAEPTKLRVALSPEALIHYAHMRLCVRAQSEIRECVQKMVALAVQVAPELADRLVPKCEYTLCCEEANSCGKFPSREEARRRILEEN